MKKTLIIGALALVSTLSFAIQEGTQNFHPEALEKIKSIKTMSPMSLEKIDDLGAATLTGLAYSSKSIFIAVSDYFWATKCTNSYENFSAWIREYQDTSGHTKKTAILMKLQGLSSANADAKQAYKAIILSERIVNCGSDDDAQNFIELIK